MVVGQILYVAKAAETEDSVREIRWARRALASFQNSAARAKDVSATFAKRLHESVDGRALRESARSTLSTSWIRAPASAIPARDYVHYHQVHLNALPCRVRTSRGRGSGAETRCRALCNSTETAEHVIQQCCRTHGGRVLRHDKVVGRIASGLRQKGWTVYEEKSYDTAVGRRRPDITAVKDRQVVILDAAVVGCGIAFEAAHQAKLRKYMTHADLGSAVAGACEGVTSDHEVNFVSCVLNWRGVWCAESVQGLRAMGLSMKQLLPITTLVLNGSWLNWVRFNSMTSVSRMGRRRER